MRVRCIGTVQSARESPPNKRLPDRGGHWIVAIAVERCVEGEVADGSVLRTIVPKELVRALRTPPRLGDRVELVGMQVDGSPTTVRVEALRRIDGELGDARRPPLGP